MARPAPARAAPLPAPAFGLLALALLAGCLPAHPALSPPRAAGGRSLDAPPLRPEAFFLGRTHGLGRLDIRTRGAQTVRVEGSGEPLDGGSFRLVQRIQLGDDAPTDRTWIMTPTADSTWTGTLTDAAGPVALRADGSTLHIRYRLGRFSTFHQRLTLQPDGRTVLNRSSARVLGVPVARLTEVISRDEPVPDTRRPAVSRQEG